MMLICFLQRKLYFNIATTDLFPKNLLWLSWLSVFKVMLNIVQLQTWRQGNRIQGASGHVKAKQIDF